MRKRVIAMLIVAIYCGPSLTAQSTAPTQLPRSSDPEILAHHLFFRSLAVLSRKADELDSSKHAGGPLRAFAAKLHLSTEDATALLSIAVALDAQLGALDRKAAAIISYAKKQRTGDGLMMRARDGNQWFAI